MPTLLSCRDQGTFAEGSTGDMSEEQWDSETADQGEHKGGP